MRDAAMGRIASWALAGVIAAGAAMAGEARSLDFAVYQKTSAGFSFEPAIAGDFAEFAQQMGSAKMLLFAHTPAAKGGDVISMTTNVLRDASGGLDDYGVECQLTFYDESEGDNPDYRVAGLCRIRHGRETFKVLVPKTSLPDTSEGASGWIKIGEDAKSGIAFYASVSK